MRHMTHGGCAATLKSANSQGLSPSWLLESPFLVAIRQWPKVQIILAAWAWKVERERG